jgi:hypothetical protein
MVKISPDGCVGILSVGRDWSPSPAVPVGDPA